MSEKKHYIHFDSWDENYRFPLGAVKKKDELTFKVKGIDEDLSAVYLMIRKDEEDFEEIELIPGERSFYQTTYKIGDESGLYFYAFRFEIRLPEESYSAYFGNNPDLLGGEGELYYNLDDLKEYQLTVYEKEDYAPDWYLNGVAYHIFVDRFYNGNENKEILNPKPKSMIYANKFDIPRYIREDSGDIVRWDFFGGNLKGIIEKLPYLKDLGISILYLSPIFEARSNHKYDTGDYRKVDPMFGDKEIFEELVKKTKELNMHIILDGVFNHSGADSIYFNKEGTYASLGAYQSQESPYFNWYSFNDFPDDYESWWGVDDLPRINTELEEVQDFFLKDEDSVVKYWNKLGVSGWRLDVVDELSDHFLWELRKSLEESSNGKERVVIGEVWEDASNKVSYGKRRHYINGEILNGVMNYPFRILIIGYLNKEISAEYMTRALTSLKENYPRFAFYSGMNNVGSHDTKRIKTVLDENIYLVKLAFALMFMFPGTPTIYYGDEAGVMGEEDPDNRRPFPWGREDTEMQDFIKNWTHFRKENEVLKTGSFIPFAAGSVFGILRITDDDQWCVVFVNPTSQTAFIDYSHISEFTKTSFEEFFKEKNIQVTSLDPYSYILFTSEDE